MRTLRAIIALGGLNGRGLTFSTFLGTLAAAFGVALMTAAGFLISRAAERPPILSLMTLVVAVRFFGLARPLARYCERLASHDIALRALGRIRSRFYERIEPLAPAGLEAFREGDLLTRMIADVDSLQGLHPKVLQPSAVSTVVAIGCVTLAFWLLPPAGVTLALGLMLAGAALPIVSAARFTRTARMRTSVRSEMHADLAEVLAGAEELAVFGARDSAIARIADADVRLTGSVRRDAQLSALVAGAGLLIAGLTLVAVLVESVAGVRGGTLDRVDLVALALVVIASFDVAAGLPAAARELTITLASGRRVLELCAREPRIREPERPVQAPPPAPEVALAGVTARYGPSGRAVLARADLKLEPGRRTAIVGPSGAGKTTVVNLLLRFLDPEEGNVTIAGLDLRDYRQEDVRRTFAVAGQDSHIFDSTIRQNLLLARPESEDADLHRALRLARIDDWVESLPAGLDTFVGEDGTELSGGQRQRLVLARALLAEAPVLVLDEPAAHLDPETARALMRDVLNAAGERTVLLITHRPEGLDRMDEVLTLTEGRFMRAAA